MFTINWPHMQTCSQLRDMRTAVSNTNNSALNFNTVSADRQSELYANSFVFSA